MPLCDCTRVVVVVPNYVTIKSVCMYLFLVFSTTQRKTGKRKKNMIVGAVGMKKNTNRHCSCESLVVQHERVSYHHDVLTLIISQYYVK